MNIFCFAISHIKGEKKGVFLIKIGGNFTQCSFFLVLGEIKYGVQAGGEMGFAL